MYDLGSIRSAYFFAIMFISIKNFLFGQPEDDETMDDLQKDIIFRLFGNVLFLGVISFLLGNFSVRTSAVQLLAGLLGWTTTNAIQDYLANRS